MSSRWHRQQKEELWVDIRKHLFANFAAQTINYTFNQTPDVLNHFHACSPGFGVFPGGLSLLYTIFFMPESDGWLTDKLLNEMM